MSYFCASIRMMKSVFASVFPESSRKVLEPKHTGILDPDVTDILKYIAEG